MLSFSPLGQHLVSLFVKHYYKIESSKTVAMITYVWMGHISTTTGFNHVIKSLFGSQEGVLSPILPAPSATPPPPPTIKPSHIATVFEPTVCRNHKVQTCRSIFSKLSSPGSPSSSNSLPFTADCSQMYVPSFYAPSSFSWQMG